MTRLELGAAVAGALLFAFVTLPASAASVATNVFLTNMVPNVDFLHRSSTFALANSKGARLRDFARGETKEQIAVAHAIDVWIKADPVVIAAATGGVLDAGAVVTGRSVAIDASPVQDLQAAQAADTRLALGQEDIDSLEGLDGRDFDDLYKQKQLDALTQIQTDCQDYLARGDDRNLLALAKRELPKINQRLAALRKL